jgi:hypothetical protein
MPMSGSPGSSPQIPFQWDHQDMSHKRSDGTPSIVLGRTVFALVGVLWGMRSLQAFTEPNFTDPESASDWWAVVSFSLAFTLLPVGLALLVRLTQRGGRTSRVLLAIVALGAVTTAIANVIEDGMGVDAAGIVYLVSTSLTMLMMIALAGVLLASRPRWPGVVVLGTLIGMLNFELGGGVLVLLVWGAAAVAVRQRTTP